MLLRILKTRFLRNYCNVFFLLINEKNKNKIYFEHKQTTNHLLPSCNKTKEKYDTVKSFGKLSTQTFTHIPTVVFHSESPNQIQIVFSQRTKRLIIRTVEQDFFEVQPNHRRHLSTKLHPVFRNLGMRTTCNLSHFINILCNAIWSLQPGSISDEQICACPGCKLQLQVAEKVPIKRGLQTLIPFCYTFLD